MDHRLDYEEASNDTTMISELIKSAEAMQSTPPVTCGSAGKNDLLEQTQTHAKIINVIEKQSIIPTPTTTVDRNANNLVTFNQGANVVDNSNKLGHIRHVNIPYILNGELYQIQKQEGENVTVKCCHCPPDRVYRGSVRSTGNFHMHIKRRHPDLLEKLHNMKVNALLERRDRLMRNRKVSIRNNHRSRQGGVGISLFNTQAVSIVPIGAFNDKVNLNVNNSLKTPPTSSTPSDLGLLQTHKLKIKEVFERHQLQQREAAESRNWDKSHESYVEEPKAINYSLKSEDQSKDSSSKPTLSPAEQNQQNNLDSMHLQSSEHLTNSSRQLLFTESKNSRKENDVQQYSIRDISTTSSQSSILSSVSTNLSPHRKITAYERNIMENIQVHLDCLRDQNGLTVVKPEQLMASSEEEQQAIDLSMHTDSGIFTNCKDSSYKRPNSNANHENSNGRRAGSQRKFAPDTFGDHCDGGDNAFKWQDLLHNVANSLSDIQHEIKIHNQIESSRISLDIAKFKFLHPSFQFDW